jgi:hypothetical protein
MSDIATISVWTASAGLMCWMVRTLMKRVEDCQTAAAHSHILAVLERERCEAIRRECQDIRAECNVAAAAAHDAMADAEEFAESIEVIEPDDDDDDDYDDR